MTGITRIIVSCLATALLASGAQSVPANTKQDNSKSSKSSSVISLDGTWLLATDPLNVGKNQEWWKTPRPEAKKTRVPWIIQEAFPAYTGAAWYWTNFTAPPNPNPGGRYILKFWAVDYKADIWLNDKFIGSHEGSEGVFELDATGVIKPNNTNRLAVRVLSPGNERIDDITLAEIPHYAKITPFQPGRDQFRQKRFLDRAKTQVLGRSDS